MNKLLWSVVPACITFGPLFMTRVGGFTGGGPLDGLQLAGVAMLIIGLGVMFRFLVRQQKLIESLRAEGGMRAAAGTGGR